MEYQSSSSVRNAIVTGDSEQGSEQGNIYVTMQVINELREKINHLQYELEYLKGRDTVPVNLLFQDDLNKIKTGLKVCSNAIRSTNDLFKTSDKKNTEISSELKALKREVNKRFDEEKDLCKCRSELLDFLHDRMGNLENRTKLLSNKIENVRDDLKEEHEQVKAASIAIQSIRDSLKNSGNRITETSNELKTLKEHISNGLLVKTKTFDDSSFVKKEDLVELRNGLFNVYGNGIQQVQERSKQLDNEIKNVWEGLKKQQEKVESVVKLAISIKSQHKDNNGKQIIIDDSISQCSNEIQKLQLDLKAEQQKNITLENKLMAFGYHLEEILQRNDIKQNPSKETCIKTTTARNSSSQRSDFLTETCKLTMSVPEMKESKSSQMDMPLKFLIEDCGWSDIACKDPDGVRFNGEAKSEYVGKGINQLDIKEQAIMDSLLEKKEAVFEQESNTSLVYCQTDELNENECVDLVYDCTSGKDGALSYLEKAHAYLQKLQMPGIFTFSDEENFAVSDEESSAVSEKQNLVKFEPGNDTTERMCSFTFLYSFLCRNFSYSLHPINF